jgi:hypothetical protein
VHLHGNERETRRKVIETQMNLYSAMVVWMLVVRKSRMNIRKLNLIPNEFRIEGRKVRSTCLAITGNSLSAPDQKKRGMKRAVRVRDSDGREVENKGAYLLCNAFKA